MVCKTSLLFGAIPFKHCCFASPARNVSKGEDPLHATVRLPPKLPASLPSSYATQSEKTFYSVGFLLLLIAAPSPSLPFLKFGTFLTPLGLCICTMEGGFSWQSV